MSSVSTESIAAWYRDQAARAERQASRKRGGGSGQRREKNHHVALLVLVVVLDHEMAPSRSIIISYQLNPPAGTGTGDLQASGVYEGEVKGSAADGQKRYYGALKEAVLEARNQVGGELTAWRDAVGKAELSKETKKTLSSEEADEEEEEENEDGS